MKKTTFGRTLALVLAMLMCLSCAVFAVNAADTVTLVVDVTYDESAHQATAIIKIENNPGFAGATIEMNFDRSVMKVIGYTVSDKFIANTVSNLDQYTNTADLAKANSVICNITRPTNTSRTGNLITVVFEVDANIAPGTYAFTVKSDDMTTQTFEDLVVNGISGSFEVKGGSTPSGEETDVDDGKTDEPKDNDAIVTSDVVSLKRRASKIKYMAGYDDGTFKPTQAATRYEVIDALRELLDIDVAAKDSGMKDVDTKHNGTVNLFTTAGIINGYTDGTFRGNKTITRAEFCKIICTILGLDTTKVKDVGFKDVRNHWAKDYINACAKEGYVKGKSEGRFDPNANITRAELVTMINRITGAKDGTSCAYDDVPSNAWYFGAVAAAAK